jgi:hypothetical protein
MAVSCGGRRHEMSYIKNASLSLFLVTRKSILCHILFATCCFRSHLRPVRANHVTNRCAAEWTDAAVDAASPVLHGAIEAHTHVAAHVQHRVDGVLVADCAVDARDVAVRAIVARHGPVDCAVRVDERDVLLLLARDRAIDRGGALAQPSCALQRGRERGEISESFSHHGTH